MFELLVVIAVIGWIVSRFAKTSEAQHKARRISTGAVVMIGLGICFGLGFAVWSMGSSVQVLPVATSPNQPQRINAETFPQISPVVADTPPDTEASTAAERKAIALPDWTQQLTSTAGSTTLTVVRGGRFASLEEAEQHAFDEAIKSAANHFRRLDPRGIATHSDTQRDLVRQTAIRKRFNEVSRHDFGTMKNHPMHQVWLQLELSPTLGDKLAEPWRHSAVETRLRTLTGWAIWLTVAATVITIGLRLDSASQGERRRIICFATVFLVISSLAIVG